MNEMNIRFSPQTTAKVNGIANELHKVNTRRVYECKRLEFSDFYHHVSFGGETFCEIITIQKVYGFVLYTWYRSKKGVVLMTGGYLELLSLD